LERKKKKTGRGWAEKLTKNWGFSLFPGLFALDAVRESTQYCNVKGKKKTSGGLMARKLFGGEKKQKIKTLSRRWTGPGPTTGFGKSMRRKAFL